MMIEAIRTAVPQEQRLANYPIFNGSGDPYHFLAKLESAFKLNKIKNLRKLEILEGCLEGQAMNWWNKVRNNCTRYAASAGENPQGAFKWMFITQYCGPDKQVEWMTQLRQLKQGLGETVTSYADKLKDLYFKADPFKRYPEGDSITQFTNGLRHELKIQVIKVQPKTLDEAVSKAKAAELAYSSGGQLSAYSLNMGNNEFKQGLEEIKVMLTQVNQPPCPLCYEKNPNHSVENCPKRSINLLKNTNNTAEIKCYNCNQMGHFAKNCPQKKDNQQQLSSVKCYNCNNMGHYAKNCTKKSAEKCQICGKNGHAALTCNQLKNNNQANRNIQFNQQNRRDDNNNNNNRNNNYNNNNNRNNNYNNNNNNRNNNGNNYNRNNNNNRNTNFGNSNTRQRNAYYSQNDENNLIENDEENYQDTLAKSKIELANSIKNLKE